MNQKTSNFNKYQVRKYLPCFWHGGTKIKCVSSVANKGQIKPEFLISNFTLFKGNRVQFLFKLLGGQKKKILVMNPYNNICIYYTTPYTLGLHGV
jgi:hypothetical protein